MSRIAIPRRELAALTPRIGMAASAAATAAALGTWSLGPAAVAGSAAAAAAVSGARFGGRTLGQWRRLRRDHRRALEQSTLFMRDGVGIVFDGTTVSALVEITPRPWQLTTISATGVGRSPMLCADVLRRQLHQYDINVSGLDVICAGYKFAARDAAAAALDTLIGPVSVPLGGTTVVVVSLELTADVLGPAYRRARRGSLPDGLCQALTIAATRVSHALAEQGFGGRLMDAAQVRGFHDAILAQVARPLAHPGWRSCGARGGVHTRTFIPARGHWKAESAGVWNHLQAHRQYKTLSLTPTGSGAAMARPLITYLVRGGDSFDKAAGYGLRAAGGQQLAALGRLLVVSQRRPLRSQAVLVDDDHRLGFDIPAGGAGVFVGSREDKTRVFVAVSAAVEPLWLVGPTLFAMQLVSRLSTQDLRIAVTIDEPCWRALAAHRGTPVLAAGTEQLAMADVVVCTPLWWEQHRDRCEAKAVLLVTDHDPGRGAVNSLVVRRGDEDRAQIAVSVDGEVTEVAWELTPIERRALIGEADLAGAPGAGPGPKFDPVVDLPVLAGRRPKPRAVAPAPVVLTVGVAAAPGQAPPPRGAEKKAPRKDRPAPVEQLPLPRQDVTSPAGIGPVPPRRPRHHDPDPAPETSPRPVLPAMPDAVQPGQRPPGPVKRRLKAAAARKAKPEVALSPPRQAPVTPPNAAPNSAGNGRHHRSGGG